jgi:hypothetical protein
VSNCRIVWRRPYRPYLLRAKNRIKTNCSIKLFFLNMYGNTSKNFFVCIGESDTLKISSYYERLGTQGDSCSASSGLPVDWVSRWRWRWFSWTYHH